MFDKNQRTNAPTHQRTAVLTIAGSDPSGGAGIQADLETFKIFGVDGLSVITAITAQNENRVFGINPIPADQLTQQLFAVSSNRKIDAIKIGMIGSSSNVQAIVMFLRSCNVKHIVLDPVFVSTSGSPLLERNALQHFKNELIPYATLITPNLNEADTLAGMHIWNIGTMKEAARQIRNEAIQMSSDKKNISVLIKGGHLSGDPTDILFDGTEYTEFSSKRIDGPVRCGTGCRLSSAIAASLAKGSVLKDSVKKAKGFIEDYIGSI